VTTARQRAYLHAMGIPVWLARARGADAQPAASTGRVQLGPGQGPVLLLCGAIHEPACLLASDVARALACGPVWAWPAAPGEGLELPMAASEGLFTHAIIFGSETEIALFGGPAPDMLGPALVLRAPALDTLASSAGARRGLWRILADNRLAKASVMADGKTA